MTELAAAEDQVRRASSRPTRSSRPCCRSTTSHPSSSSSSSSSSSRRRRTTTTTAEQQQPPPPPSQQQSSPFDGAALVETVLALFKRVGEDELPSPPATKFRSFRGRSGWWQGRNVKTGAVGIFPANYTRPDHGARPAQGPSTPSGPVIAVVRVLPDFSCMAKSHSSERPYRRSGRRCGGFG